MPPLRLCYLLASVGFGLSAVGSAYGIAPHWPNRIVWTFVAVVAAIALLAVALHPEISRDIATSTVVVASGARMVGWIASETPWPLKVSATGTWLIVCSLVFVVHHKHRLLKAAQSE